MTADEIRARMNRLSMEVADEIRLAELRFLSEVAAQLAELNQKFATTMVTVTR